MIGNLNDVTWWRDPAWQFVGVVLAVVSIGIALWVAWRQRSVKRLSYEIKVSDLLSVGAAIRERVQILYDNEPVENVTLNEVTFSSTGTVPIMPNDFVVPVVLDFGDTAEVLSSSVAMTHPPDLALKITVARSAVGFGSQKVEVHPTLLNPGDSFTVNCLVNAGGEFQ